MLIHNKDDIQFVTEFLCFWDTFYIQCVTRNMTVDKKLWMSSSTYERVFACFHLNIFRLELNFTITWLPYNIFTIFFFKQLNKLWKKTFINYSATVMFRGTLCIETLNISFIYFSNSRNVNYYSAFLYREMVQVKAFNWTQSLLLKNNIYF